MFRSFHETHITSKKSTHPQDITITWVLKTTHEFQNSPPESQSRLFDTELTGVMHPTVAASAIIGLDTLSDDIVIRILNTVGDVRTLARCRCVNKRLSGLVTQADRLTLRVDTVTPTEPELNLLLFLQNLLFSFVTSVASFLSYTPKLPHLVDETKRASKSTLVDLLRGFDRIRHLEVKLPGSLELQFGTVVRWKAEFGRTLRSCVILAVRSMTTKSMDEDADMIHDDDEDYNGEIGMKERVIMTVGVMMAASIRHDMVREVVNGECGNGMEKLVVRDRGGEWTVVMNQDGLEEWRRSDDWRRRTVPAAKIRMMHAQSLDLERTVRMEGVSLVVVTAVEREQTAEIELDQNLVMDAFDGVYRSAVGLLLKKPVFRLEINSF